MQQNHLFFSNNYESFHGKIPKHAARHCYNKEINNAMPFQQILTKMDAVILLTGTYSEMLQKKNNRLRNKNRLFRLVNYFTVGF